MTKAVIPLHGRQHCSGGADPIPCLIPRLTSPTYQPMPLSVGANLFSNVTWTWEFDETEYAGGHIQNGAAGGDGRYFVVSCVLSPKGSVWVFDLIYETGPDFGKIKLLFGTPLPNDIWEGSLQYPGNVTYYQAGSGGVVDGYSAGATKDVVTSGLALFRVNGATDVPLTAFATDPESGYLAGNGGAGDYYIKVMVDGKSASSSAYKARIQSLAVRRMIDL